MFGRIVATVIRLIGDFDLAEEATQEAFATAVEQWPRDGVPHNPRAWIIEHRAAQGDRSNPPPRRALPTARRTEPHPRGRGRTRTRLIRGGARARRASAPDLHLLPSGARAGGAGRAVAADAVRTDDRRNRARLSGPACDDGAAAGARQAQDSHGRHPLRNSAARGAARADRRRDRGHLPGLQRRLCGDGGRRAGARGPVPRSHPAWAHPVRASARRARAARRGAWRTAQANR